MSKKEDRSLDHLLQFIQFTHQFQGIERIILVKDKERWENDMEHSYQLALLAWYLIEHDKLAFDASRVVKLAMVHDLVEAYAGDTYVFGSDDELMSKKAREAKAAEQLKQTFPDFVSLHSLIAEYETAASKESKFVHALDKLIPVLNIYMDSGRTWHLKKISLKQLLAAKKDIPIIAPELAPYYHDLIQLLQNGTHFFPDAP